MMQPSRASLALALAVALAPPAAGAQALDLPSALPVGRGAQPPAGITVSVTAQQRIAVRQVQFSAYVRGDVDEASALAAMRAAGIEEPSVGASGGLPTGNRGVLRGTIREVSRAKLVAIAAAADAYVRAHPGTAVENVQFSAPLAGCPALEAPLRARALAEARRRAEAIAGAAGVGLDGVTAVAESGGCPALGDDVRGPQVDPATLTTTLFIGETVTFAIAPLGGARRRTL